MGEWIDDSGQKLYGVHEEGTCRSEFCPIHNPSNHPLCLMPQIWDSESRSMTRVCTHRITHVDMDDEISRRRGCVDKCDGCCVRGDDAD